MKLKLFTSILLLFFALHIGHAQFGYGLTFQNDLYQRFTNPESDEDVYRSAGSAILNFAIGPKIWVGGKKASLSVEGLAGIGVLGLAVKDYKGLGTSYFPIMAKLNFNGLSGFDKEGKMGFFIGGGVQYSRTELYGLTSKYEALGVDRSLFMTYVAQAGYGFGISGFGVSGTLKYGWNPDTKANLLAVGVQWDFNAPKLKKIQDSSSSL